MYYITNQQDIMHTVQNTIRFITDQIINSSRDVRNRESYSAFSANAINIFTDAIKGDFVIRSKSWCAGKTLENRTDDWSAIRRIRSADRQSFLDFSNLTHGLVILPDCFFEFSADPTNRKRIACVRTCACVLMERVSLQTIKWTKRKDGKRGRKRDALPIG